MARNTVAYGQHIALVPYSEEHVSIRQEWMKDPRNRLDDQEKEHTYEEEAALRLKWSTDPARVVFMIADVDKLSDPASRLIERFIGEAHYTLAEVDGATEAKLDVLILDQTVRRRTFLSEALLFLMQFGVYRLNVKKFVIEPGNPSPNRLDTLLCKIHPIHTHSPAISFKVWLVEQAARQLRRCLTKTVKLSVLLVSSPNSGMSATHFPHLQTLSYASDPKVFFSGYLHVN
eukprot:m.127274 g.127274  ORF g.127274 m.127274 type:complete len:231 (+) comp13851_c0_seq13:71-763(+)